MAFDAQAATGEDIVEGLRGPFTFTHSDIIFDSPVNETTLANDAYAAVVWSLNAIHTGTFAGLEPTRQSVVIEGVTLIQMPQRDEDEAQFMRYIDWSEVFGQLGVAMSGRGILAES